MSRLSSTALALAAATALLAGPASAAIVTVPGNTTGAPTFNRPLEDLSALSAVGTSVRYTALPFTVSVSGEYNFLTNALFDSFAILYSTSFNAGSSLTNALVANDDLVSFNTSGFAFDLTAGTPYVYVVTGFDSTEFGAFTTTIGGPGNISVVPEPMSAALMALGLAAVGAGVARRRSPVAH